MPKKVQQVTFNRRRARSFFRYIYTCFIQKRAPYNHLKLPEHEFLPAHIRRRSREHRLFLFFASWMSRRGNHATEVYGLSRKVSTEYPWLIDPADERAHDPLYSAPLLRIIPRSQHTKFGNPVQWWWNNLKLLRDLYQSDPLNIFIGLPVHKGWRVARQELMRRLLQFQGIGEKIACLLISQFQKEILPDDTWYWKRVQRLPVFTTDAHVMRLFRMFDLITEWETCKVKKLAGPISDFAAELCYDLRLNPADVSQAMWLIGARTCDKFRRQPRERARAYCKRHCPAYLVCRGVIPLHTIVEPGRRQWLAHLRYEEMELHEDL